jgi:hypothetical protein
MVAGPHPPGGEFGGEGLEAVMANNHKPYVLITVSGGVASIASSRGAEVDILDFDDLKSLDTADIEGGVSLSDREWAFLKKSDPEMYERLLPGRARCD